jgi:hypothetical protein
VNLLPARRHHEVEATAGTALVLENPLLWVRVGTQIGEAWWYPPRAVTFERLNEYTIGNDAIVAFPASPWNQAVTLRYIAAGPEPDYMCILGTLGNRMAVPPGGIVHFARHAMTVAFR